MNPFFKKVRTQAEKDELLRQARIEYESIPPQFAHLVAASDEDYMAKVADTIEVEVPVYVQPRPLTAAEEAELNGRLVCEQMRYNVDLYGNIPDGPLKDFARAQDEAELQKFLAPTRRAESFLESLVRQAFEKVAGNQSVPRRESDREPLAIIPKVAQLAAEQDSNSDVAKFLAAYIAKDEPRMRRVARELASAAA